MIITPETITLQVLSPRLWDNLKAKSAFNARFSTYQDKQLMAESAIEDADLVFILGHMRQAVMMAYTVLNRLMYGLTQANSLWVNLTFNYNPGDENDPTGGDDIIRVGVMPDTGYPTGINSRESRIAFVNNGMNNQSAIVSAEQSFYDIMECYLLCEWYKLRGASEAIKDYEQKLASAIQLLHNQSGEFYRIKLT